MNSVVRNKGEDLEGTNETRTESIQPYPLYDGQDEARAVVAGQRSPVADAAHHGEEDDAPSFPFTRLTL